MTIWNSCELDMVGNRIFRPIDIKNYCDTFGINMSYREKNLVLCMKSWAGQVIVELEQDKGD